MFAKTSLINFVYDTTDVFCFSEDNLKVQAIYIKYKIEKCFIYQNLTYIDSTSLFFVFVCALMNFVAIWCAKSITETTSKLV